MADFLTRLVGRTMGLVPTVQPIIVPMYAPTPGIPGEQSASVVFDHEIAGDVDGLRQAQVTYAGSPRQDFFKQEHTLGASLVDDLPSQGLQENLPSIAATQQEDRYRTSIPQTGSEYYTSLGRDKGVGTGHPQEALLRSDPRRESSDQFPLSLAEDISVSVEPHAARIRLEQSSTEGHLMNVVRYPQNSISVRTQFPGSPEGVPSTSEPAVRVRASQPRGIVPLTHNGIQPANQRETVAEPPAAIPTVQVTIGRIEVRAMPPANPRPQPRRSEPPVMGLEEYLNQRAKGGY